MVDRTVILSVLAPFSQSFFLRISLLFIINSSIADYMLHFTMLINVFIIVRVSSLFTVVIRTHLCHLPLYTCVFALPMGLFNK